MNLKEIKRISDSEVSIDALTERMRESLFEQINKKGRVLFGPDRYRNYRKVDIYKSVPGDPLATIKKVCNGSYKGRVPFWLLHFGANWDDYRGTSKMSLNERLKKQPDEVLEAFLKFQKPVEKMAKYSFNDFSTDAPYFVNDKRHYTGDVIHCWANEEFINKMYIDNKREWLVPLYQYLLDNGIPLKDLNYVHICAWETPVSKNERAQELQKEFFEKNPKAVTDHIYEHRFSYLK